MSQAGSFAISSLPPGTIVETLTGNSGGAVGPDGSNNINVVGDGTTIDVAGNPGTNTLTISALSSGGATSFPTDSGTATPAAGVLNIISNHAALHAGSSVLFSGSGNTVTLNVTDADLNTIIGNGAGNLTITGTNNTALGFECARQITSGSTNVFIGTGTAAAVTSGTDNTIVGTGAGAALLTGVNNTIIGTSAASAYISSESSNIIIGANTTATIGQSNTLVIGAGTGASAGQLNRAFICGIDGVNVGSVATVVTENGNQLGTAVITGGTGITVTPGANSIVISGSGTIVLGYTNVSTSPYVVLVGDDYISVDCSGGPITIQLPNAATLGKTFVIKDRTGSAAINNITVTTVGGVVNIDGAPTFIMNSAFQAISIIGNNTSYEVY